MSSRVTKIDLEGDVVGNEDRDQERHVGENGFSVIHRVRASWEDVSENIGFLDWLARDFVMVDDFLGYLFKDTGLFVLNEFHTYITLKRRVR